MAYTVVLADPIHEQGIAILEQIATVRQANQGGNLPLTEQVRDANAIVTRLTQVTPALIDAAPHLRAISRHGVGVDSVDVPYATARGIPVLYTPAANAESVAEHTLGMMLAVSKMVLLGDRAQRNGDFQSRTRLIGFELYGKTLGIVGAGRVGSRVARMCRAALDMHVLAYDPYLSPDDARLRGVELVTDLAALLQESDYISLHAPLTPDTRDLIGARELSLMKPTAILINCARGGILDEQGAGDRAAGRPNHRRCSRCLAAGAAAAGPSPLRPGKRHRQPAHGCPHRRGDDSHGDNARPGHYPSLAGRTASLLRQP